MHQIVLLIFDMVSASLPGSESRFSLYESRDRQLVRNPTIASWPSSLLCYAITQALPKKAPQHSEHSLNLPRVVGTSPTINAGAVHGR